MLSDSQKPVTLPTLQAEVNLGRGRIEAMLKVLDVEEQLAVGHAGDLRTYRGPLGRESLRLEVVDLPGRADRLAWLATWLPQLNGSGIVYTLTKRDADLVAEWLTAHDILAEAYSGEVETERRVKVEDRLLANELKTYRGPLGRSSLRLEVVDLPGRADRLAWLATWLPQLDGSGIVYTLTKRDAELVADWLSGRGIAAEAYSGEIESERRIEVEERLLRNDLKAVVATSALGMGYDKPDLGFVVHYQAPGSVISYYQQVGRAGRAVERAEVVLLRGAEDRRIQDFFIQQAFPPREHAVGSTRCSRCSTSRARSSATAAGGARGPDPPGSTTPTATRTSPRCAAASRRPWPPSGPTGAA